MSGIFLGMIAGVIDVIPMVLQGLTWDANLAAISMWVVVGLLLTMTTVRLPSPVKGVLIAVLVLLPSAILIGWKEPFSLAPILIMTCLLGSALGFFIEKIGVRS
ncbi:MAG: hypothetical protein A2487_10540 [Candidatus Raymondbacteria bacterium RifOxyC12_full_50_8]|uniref:Uncharacterized protein n=1 Tax=Candidatus Raymondbacteria bacterium RIFOXYD12_FULL_49_13 TaxID=1817890 RepID=A0A1F7F0R8_UNCRA|nr:MAG: hypothetical protein A2248_07830 [Candidatus Raymondbacteria bacterium RIFOXYA2_FULL_49_16]OGJ96575.1 MAG: hypothetical protein A2487_10540 [Candidatus Raymondbacteria bacterium RifOxyC12_full_50_8]OGK00254.1 MAG: hypothetical protein A2519_01205 [Candidatus Raymondbacteria bacterium RIFOXYD12_FULL_49_13]OGK02085.1 MAG: hypothetical protein A2350_21230 [Candidatus Raymondbacteria bacterium RifOxyB12_full_50_8]OGP42313.1 MAG: hypothetical protein A2324_20060 [Candidatus Raymondbacteria b